MRNFVLVAAVAALGILVASFSPGSSGSSGDTEALASVSPWELTLAAKDLPTGESADAY